MPETMSHTSSTTTPRGRARADSCPDAGTPADESPRPRVTPPSGRVRHSDSRIGVGLAGGFYPAPHRYQLYLSADCPRSLRVRAALDLLGLGGSVAVTQLAPSGGTPDAYASLRRVYEATWHRYDGPLTVPALCDRWTGRVVSNRTADILRDLAGLSETRSATGRDRERA
ncbi:hypothetical protein ACFV6E_27970 [Streptomyces sp. NPDC059785]|uniref:hypothetical protein n=1 Tax=unclassified Streptomyces TaxID=2593676 RepID=UPI0036523737